MAVHANTVETYDNSVIREDLQDSYRMISPEETPFQTAARETEASNTLFEWPVVELAAPDASNRVAEGEDAPGVDAGNMAKRLSNYTQISDKVAKVSHTSEAVDAAAKNLQKLAMQIVMKQKEMKRDMEVMLLSNVAASAASSGSPRQTAGLPAFLKTNVDFVTGGANPTLSGTTEGYPNAAATAGTTPLVFAEAKLNAVIEKCWNEGASPSLIMVNGGNKRRISQAFVGNATGRDVQSTSKRVTNAIDVYDSDFGVLTVMANRFMPTNNPAGANNSFNVFVLDPEYIAVAFLDEMKQRDLAKTGHSDSKLIWCEYGLQVDNEKAHGLIRDTTNAIA